MSSIEEENPSCPRQPAAGSGTPRTTLTTREVADHLCITHRQVIGLIEGGYLDAVAIGGIGRRDIGVRAQDLERFRASRDPFVRN